MTPEQAWEADLRYQEYRAECYAQTLENIAILVGAERARGVIRNISIGQVHDYDGIEAQSSWDDCIFDWPDLIYQFKPYINRFEVSLRVGGKLCALALGRPSNGRDNVTIHFLERNKER